MAATTPLSYSVDTATAAFAEFNDRAGIAYKDKPLTAEFIAGVLAQQIEPHLFTSMRAATDRVLFSGPDGFEVVELSDGIEYQITGTTCRTTLGELYINAPGFAIYDMATGTVTVEVLA